MRCTMALTVDRCAGLDCDYLVCSGYKVFARIWVACVAARRSIISRSFAKISSDVTPDKLEEAPTLRERRGHGSRRSVLEDLGRDFLAHRAGPAGGSNDLNYAGATRMCAPRTTWADHVSAPRMRRKRSAGMHTIAEYERALSKRLLDEVGSIPRDVHASRP